MEEFSFYVNPYPFTDFGSRGKSVAKKEVALTVGQFAYSRLLSRLASGMESYDHPRLIGFWKGGIVDVRERKWPVRKKHENPKFASS